ncbi:MAG: 2-amino-4-hydroxy-6-hydroxymethyldihydropteridine diphosphokinase [Mariprofundales bacterium]
MSWLKCHRVLVGMGSNIDPECHLTAGSAALRERFPSVCFSQVYRSAAVGMAAGAADFLNACALFSCDDEADTLQAWLKQVEDSHGRDRSHGSWQPRTLDLDVMMFDDEWLEDVMAYPHCYLPAAELVVLPAPCPACSPTAIDVVYQADYLTVGGSTIVQHHQVI